MDIHKTSCATWARLYNSFQRTQALKRKKDYVTTAVKENLSTALDIEIDPSSPLNRNLSELITILADFDQMKLEGKERVEKAKSYAEKVQLMTAFIPPSWSREKVMGEFQISQPI